MPNKENINLSWDTDAATFIFRHLKQYFTLWWANRKCDTEQLCEMAHLTVFHVQNSAISDMNLQAEKVSTLSYWTKDEIKELTCVSLLFGLLRKLELDPFPLDSLNFLLGFSSEPLLLFTGVSGCCKYTNKKNMQIK